MIARAILFNGAMVRALLAGAKTQTRRPIRGCVERGGQYSPERHYQGWYPKCPYGKKGEYLWVRETFWAKKKGDAVRYRADAEAELTLGEAWTWKPAIHMPRWACRILLKVKDVRVERIQEMHPEDFRAEGTKRDFPQAWDAIYQGQGLGWSANPWVWVVEFQRV